MRERRETTGYESCSPYTLAMVLYEAPAPHFFLPSPLSPMLICQRLLSNWHPDLDWPWSQEHQHMYQHLRFTTHAISLHMCIPTEL